MGDIRDAEYFVFDGRAVIDFDRACVLGVYNAKNDEEAFRYFKADWQDVDAVMFKKVGQEFELLFVNDEQEYPYD